MASLYRAHLLVDDRATRDLVEGQCRERGYSLKDNLPPAGALGEPAPFELLIVDDSSPALRADFQELCRRFDRDTFYALALVRAETTRDGTAPLTARFDDCAVLPLTPAVLALRLTIAERNWRRHLEQLREIQALRETSDQLNLASTGTSDGFWYLRVGTRDWNRSTMPVWYSAQMKALLGYQEHEFGDTLESWSRLLHPQDAPRVFQALDDHLSRRIPYDVEYRLLVRSGKYRWFRARGQASWDDAGVPIRFAGSVRDVTEQHLFDEALRASEGRHRLIAETVNDIIWESDLPNLLTSADDSASWELRITYISPAIERVLGYTPAEAMAMPVEQMLTPAAFAVCAELIGRELAADQRSPDPARQQSVELDFISKTGDIRTCEVRSVFVRDPQGQPKGVLGVSRDITERKHAELELQKSREQWRSLVEHAPDTILTIDRRHRITFVNRPILPTEDDDLIGTRPYDDLPPREGARFGEILEEVFERGHPAYHETDGILRAAPGTWYGCRVGPLLSDGQVTSLIMIATDITARRRSEEALRKERSLLQQLVDVHERERQLYAYEIHDGLMQHLTASLMHLEVVNESQHLRSEPAREELTRGLKLLRSAVSEGRRLISGLRPPILDEAGIVAAIEYLVSENQDALPDVEFIHDTNFSRLAPPLENAVFRIVQEALTNVRRHSRCQRARVHMIQSSGRLRVEVRDWGIGFHPEKVAEDRFGLHGIKERARLLGGQATIDSEPGKGASVRVEFPLVLSN